MNCVIKIIKCDIEKSDICKIEIFKSLHQKINQIIIIVVDPLASPSFPVKKKDQFFELFSLDRDQLKKVGRVDDGGAKRD